MPAAKPSVGVHSALLEGQPIPGYRLVRRCGWGGFAEVWEAEAPGGFRVALKLVRLSGKKPSGEFRSLEIVRGIRHPNLLVIFGAWQVDDFLVIGMELADRSLWDRFLEAVAQGLRGIPRGELLGYLEAASAGIDYLNAYRHSVEGRELVGVQHRDIKPQNILLFGGGAKVADFGMVRVMDRSVASHTGSWTLPYAAPEFFRGRTARQSDQYSLAATYCHLRGGRLPFGGTAAEITAGHMFGEPELDALPEPERPIVVRALSKEPERRWPDCRAFLAALRSVGAGTVPDVVAGQDPADVSALISCPFVFSSETPAFSSTDSEFPSTPAISLDSEETEPSPGRPTRSRRRWLRDACTAGGVAAGLALAAVATGHSPAARPIPAAPGSAATPDAHPAIAPRPEPLRPTPTAPVPVAADPGLIPPAATAPNVSGGMRAEADDAAIDPAEPKEGPTIARSSPASPGRVASAPSPGEEPRLEGAQGGRGVAPTVPKFEPRPDGAGDARPSEWMRAEATGAAVNAASTPDTDQAIDESSLAVLEQTITGQAPAPRVSPLDGIRLVESKAHTPTGPAPGPVATAIERGRVHLGRGAYAQAVTAFTEALRQEPAHPDAHFFRGMAHHLDQQYREALTDYTEALGRRSDDANTYLFRGRVQHALGRNDRALDDLTRAIQLRPHDANAYLARGEVLHDLGAYDRAIIDDTKAVELRPKDPLPRYHRGVARYHAGDNIGAIADFTEVLRLDQQHVGALRYRGDAFARIGQGARAGADRDALDRLLKNRARPRPGNSPARRPDEHPTTPRARAPQGRSRDILRAEAPRAKPTSHQ